MPGYAVVVPTVGRPSLATLLHALGQGPGPLPAEIVLVNDRPAQPVGVAAPTAIAGLIRVLDGEGRGPAAARNLGWRATDAPWVVFLDDDVVPGPRWREELVADLRAAETAGAAGVQGRLTVPLPPGRATDWQRDVAGLANADWITADMAYRRDALEAVGGFDERFPRAYREDVEIALRLSRSDRRLVRGDRRASHPVRPAPWWISVSRQAGNADDALLRRLYGPNWRRLADLPPGRRHRHAATVLSGLVAGGALLCGQRRLAGLAGLGWLLGTAEFAIRRMLPGPRTPGELLAMAVTSIAIPPMAVLHWARGWYSHRDVAPLFPGAGASNAADPV